LVRNQHSRITEPNEKEKTPIRCLQTVALADLLLYAKRLLDGTAQRLFNQYMFACLQRSNADLRRFLRYCLFDRPEDGIQIWIPHL
jgi:hypothetical protein